MSPRPRGAILLAALLLSPALAGCVRVAGADDAVHVSRIGDAHRVEWLLFEEPWESTLDLLRVAPERDSSGRPVPSLLARYRDPVGDPDAATAVVAFPLGTRVFESANRSSERADPLAPWLRRHAARDGEDVLLHAPFLRFLVEGERYAVGESRALSYGGLPLQVARESAAGGLRFRFTTELVVAHADGSLEPRKRDLVLQLAADGSAAAVSIPVDGAPDVPLVRVTREREGRTPIPWGPEPALGAAPQPLVVPGRECGPLPPSRDAAPGEPLPLAAAVAAARNSPEARRFLDAGGRLVGASFVAGASLAGADRWELILGKPGTRDLRVVTVERGRALGPLAQEPRVVADAPDSAPQSLYPDAWLPHPCLWDDAAREAARRILGREPGFMELSLRGLTSYEERPPDEDGARASGRWAVVLEASTTFLAPDGSRERRIRVSAITGHLVEDALIAGAVGPAA